MGFAISSLRFAIGEAMAEEPAKNTQVKLEYETKDPTPWTYADDLGCAIVLIMFLVTAWVGIGFLLLAILEIFGPRADPRISTIATLTSGALAAVVTIIAYQRVKRP